jgi:hypothetical protein
MKHALVTLIVILSMAANAMASDSISIGARGGVVTGNGSSFTEAFADLHLNRLVSIGATVAYVMIDRGNVSSVKRDESLPITALFKVHAPIPVFSPYAGLGAALVFHDKRGTKGTPVALAGGDLSLGTTPFFANVEYRHQFDDALNFLGGGVGVRF